MAENEQQQTSENTAVDPALEKRISEKLGSTPAGGPQSASQDFAARANDGPAPHDVSAATVARMLGLATASEIRLLEGKLDLLSSKVSTLQIRAEKMLTILNSMPTGSDLERIDVQLGSMKSLLKDLIDIKGGKEG